MHTQDTPLEHVGWTETALRAADPELPLFSPMSPRPRRAQPPSTSRSSAWLDAEREALDQLHVEPGADAADLRALLEDTRTCLSILLETLRAIPGRCRLVTAWGLPSPAPFEVHLRWTRRGSRTSFSRSATRWLPEAGQGRGPGRRGQAPYQVCG